MKYVILALAFALPVSAQVYKCEQNGVVTYSQTPCSQDAEVTDYSRSADDHNKSAGTTPAASSAAQTMDRLGQSVKKRDLSDKIKRLERLVDRQIKNRDAEVASIANRKGRVVRNLAGSVYEDSLSSDILAATTIWNTRIDATNREIDQLRAEYNKL
jgi:hypothetical protein